jgi:hypothetical protein
MSKTGWPVGIRCTHLARRTTTHLIWSALARCIHDEHGLRQGKKKRAPWLKRCGMEAKDKVAKLWASSKAQGVRSPPQIMQKRKLLYDSTLFPLRGWSKTGPPFQNCTCVLAGSKCSREVRRPQMVRILQNHFRAWHLMLSVPHCPLQVIDTAAHLCSGITESLSLLFIDRLTSNDCWMYIQERPQSFSGKVG